MNMPFQEIYKLNVKNNKFIYKVPKLNFDYPIFLTCLANVKVLDDNSIKSYSPSFWFGKQKEQTYNVPTTLLVIAWVSFCLNILAMPKSAILGFIFSSKRMLLAFRSLWITRILEYLCRYSNPWAIPSMMLNRLGQSSSTFLFSSTIKDTSRSVNINK